MGDTKNDIKLIDRSRVFVDGGRFGTKLFKRGDASVKIAEKDARQVRKVMRAALGNTRDVESKELRVKVIAKAPMWLVLRQDSRNKKNWYLNVDGNPAKYILGDNIYGLANAEKQIKYIFRRCIKSVQKVAGMEMPSSVLQDVEDGNIYLNSLEFACYSNPLRVDPKKITGAWRYMFRRGHIVGEDGKTHTLEEILGVKTRTEYENSFYCWLLAPKPRPKAEEGETARKYPDVKHIMFLAYDKIEELQSGWKDKSKNAIGEDGEDYITDDKHIKNVARIQKDEALNDIQNRIRYDIGFTNAWFVHKGLTTLAKLAKHVHKEFDGKWPLFVQHYVHMIFERACLGEMWTFDWREVRDAKRAGLNRVPGLNPQVPTAAYMVMAEARVERTKLTMDGIDDKLSGNPRYWQEIAKAAPLLSSEEAESLGIDISRTREISG
jgi:hypothetical protein